MTDSQHEAWYDQYFGVDYLRIYRFADTQEQLAFLKAVWGEPRGRRLLDVACGQGRHAVELARWGFKVCGLDRSAALLEAARETAARLGTQVRYLRADVRAIPLAARAFDGAISMFTSFGYFTDERENRRALEEVARVLKPGALFVLDLANLDWVRSQPSTSQWEHQGAQVSSEYIYHEATQRALTRRTVTIEGERRVYESSVRMYREEEIRGMLSEVGLRVEQCYGGYDLCERTPQSRRMILLACREDSG